MIGKRVLRVRETSDYEATRNARLLENQARLESLGLLKTVSELRQAASPKPKRRQYQKKLYGLTPLRRSQRLNATNHFEPRRCLRLAPASSHPFTPKQDFGRRRNRITTSIASSSAAFARNSPKCQEKVTLCEGEEDKIRPANAPFIEIRGADLQISQEGSARRCNSKGRGSVYNPVFGICCHFCRQKKLCGEEDCKRCGNFDVDEPCLGKTDCSVCHSSTGVFCRACLKVRYGEEIEEVRENKGWMCPHCIEEKGINPYWICNSSICLRKQKKAPTGLAIYKAREMGYKSVAHLLMEELKRGNKLKR